MPRTPHGPTARTAMPVLLAVLASLGVAACGSSSKSPSTASTKASAATPTTATTATTPSTTAKTTTAPRTTTTAPATGSNATVAALRACLSAHGINLPNAGSSALGLLRSAAKLPKGVSRSYYESVVRGCVRTQLPPGRTVKPAKVTNPRVAQALRQFAVCMRGHQVNLPNPNTSGTGPVFDTKGINTSSPQFRAALVACSGALRAILRASPGRAGASPLG